MRVPFSWLALCLECLPTASVYPIMDVLMGFRSWDSQWSVSKGPQGSATETRALVGYVRAPGPRGWMEEAQPPYF